MMGCKFTFLILAVCTVIQVHSQDPMPDPIPDPMPDPMPVAPKPGPMSPGTVMTPAPAVTTMKPLSIADHIYAIAEQLFDCEDDDDDDDDDDEDDDDYYWCW